MQRVDVAGEFVAGGRELAGHQGAFAAFGLHGDGEGFGELGEDFGLAGLVGMELEAEGLEADLRETRVDDVEGGLLFGDEQDAAAVCEVVGDEVGDCLRLAGAGRSVQDEGLAELRVEDGRQL